MMGGVVRFSPCGECAFLVELGEEIDVSVNRRVHHLRRLVEDRFARRGVFACIPSYRSLLVRYDPLLCSYERLIMEIEEMVEDLGEPPWETHIVEIPVRYGGEGGPDLEDVAAHHGMSVEEVVRRHTAPLYHVFMLGFTPGFCYLGGLDPLLVTPRREMPRKRVPAGSVGIADRQTGIYPIESPGGWRIIGRTSLTLFDPSREDPFLVKAGDAVRFVAV